LDFVNQVGYVEDVDGNAQGIGNQRAVLNPRDVIAVG